MSRSTKKSLLRSTPPALISISSISRPLRVRKSCTTLTLLIMTARGTVASIRMLKWQLSFATCILSQGNSSGAPDVWETDIQLLDSSVTVTIMGEGSSLLEDRARSSTFSIPLFAHRVTTPPMVEDAPAINAAMTQEAKLWTIPAMVNTAARVDSAAPQISSRRRCRISNSGMLSAISTVVRIAATAKYRAREIRRRRHIRETNSLSPFPASHVAHKATDAVW